MKNLLIVSFLFIFTVTVFAGFQRLNGKTSWVNSPTAGTLWGRNSDGSAYPLPQPAVWGDGIRLVTSNRANTVVETYSFGYWQVDVNNDYMPVQLNANDYNQRGNVAMIMDVEWDINSDGDLVLKP